MATVTATPQAGKIVVTWSAANGATSYRIQRRVKGGSWSDLAASYTGGLSYVDTNVTAGTEYQYAIRGKNTAGNSALKLSAYATAL